jgi:hypothetical protein
VSGLTDVAYIQAKGYVKFALQTNGSMWRWGYDDVYSKNYKERRPFIVPINDTEPPTPPGELIRSSTGIYGDVKWLPSTDNIRVFAYDIYLDDVLWETMYSYENMILYSSPSIHLNEDKLYKLTVKASESTIFLSSDTVAPTSP